MLYKSPTFTEILKLKKHYQAIGQTEFYLQNNYPWKYVTQIENQHTYGLNDIRFTAKHQNLTFYWNLHIYNSRGHSDPWTLNTENLELITKNLPTGAMKTKFNNLLQIEKQNLAEQEKQHQKTIQDINKKIQELTKQQTKLQTGAK